MRIGIGLLVDAVYLTRTDKNKMNNSSRKDS